MCGRYAITKSVSYVAKTLRISYESARALLEIDRDRYNVAPSTQVPVVRVVRSTNGEREAVAMRWGLIPFFAKGIAGHYNTINCRIESMETSPAYRHAWKNGQRCIMPVSGFYEWHVNEDGAKQPFYIRPSDPSEEACFICAGLWDASTTAEGETILSCTMITMHANELMTEIHNTKERMPALLEAEDAEAWLNGTPDEARNALKQYQSELMIAWRVSKKVNNSRNDGSDLIQPLTAA